MMSNLHLCDRATRGGTRAETVLPVGGDLPETVIGATKLLAFRNFPPPPPPGRAPNGWSGFC